VLPKDTNRAAGAKALRPKQAANRKEILQFTAKQLRPAVKRAGGVLGVGLTGKAPSGGELASLGKCFFKGFMGSVKGRKPEEGKGGKVVTPFMCVKGFGRTKEKRKSPADGRGF